MSTKGIKEKPWFPLVTLGVGYFFGAKGIALLEAINTFLML